MDKEKKGRAKKQFIKVKDEEAQELETYKKYWYGYIPVVETYETE